MPPKPSRASATRLSAKRTMKAAANRRDVLVETLRQLVRGEARRRARVPARGSAATDLAGLECRLAIAEEEFFERGFARRRRFPARRFPAPEREQHRRAVADRRGSWRGCCRPAPALRICVEAKPLEERGRGRWCSAARAGMAAVSRWPPRRPPEYRPVVGDALQFREAAEPFTPWRSGECCLVTHSAKSVPPARIRGVRMLGEDGEELGLGLRRPEPVAVMRIGEAPRPAPRAASLVLISSGAVEAHRAPRRHTCAVRPR